MSMDPRSIRQTRRSATRRVLVFLGIPVLLIIVVVASVIAHYATTNRGPVSSNPPSHARGEHRPAPGTDPAASEVATRPMPELPATAAQPHELAPRPAGTPISLPSPDEARRTWIPAGFPATSAGALAKLKALDEHGVSGGEPRTYARAYTASAAAGAPDSRGSALWMLLTQFRESADLPEREPAPGLEVRFQITHGLIKGTADHGRFVVVCVLGQINVTNQGQNASSGVGDCQALRFSAGQWRISAGPRAAYAPSAWPGSQESVDAGYRALTGAGT